MTVCWEVVLEDHIRAYMVDASEGGDDGEGSATEQLIDVVQSYFT